MMARSGPGNFDSKPPEGPCRSGATKEYTFKDLNVMGVAEFEKNNIKEAIDRFSKAIALAEQKRVVTDAELSSVLDNRAKSFLIIGQTKNARKDVERSLSLCKNQFKGNFRFGELLLKEKTPSKALSAFGDALHFASSEKQKRQALQLFIRTAHQVPDTPEPLLENAVSNVGDNLLAKVAYDLLCHGNELEKTGNKEYFSYWDAGIWAQERLAVRTVGQFYLSQSESTEVIELQKLCCLRSTSYHKCREYFESSWMLVVYLVSQGADITRLSFYEGDSYVHAAAIFSVMMRDSGPLLWTLVEFACPRQELNRKDSEGNTVLHLLCGSRKLLKQPWICPDVRKTLCDVVLDFKVNPDLKNDCGKTALECLQPYGDLKTKSLLERVTGKLEPSSTTSGQNSSGKKKARRQKPVAPASELMKTPAAKKSTSRATPSDVGQTADVSTEQEKDTLSEPTPPLLPEPEKASPGNGHDPAQLASATSTAGTTPTPLSPSAAETTSTVAASTSTAEEAATTSTAEIATNDKNKTNDTQKECVTCREHLKFSEKCFKKDGPITKAFERLAKALSCQSSIDHTLNQQVPRAISLMARYLTVGRIYQKSGGIKGGGGDTISSIVLGLKSSHLSAILQSMIRDKKWSEVQALHLQNQTRASSTDLGKFAFGIDIEEVISDKQKCPEKEVLRVLMEHGLEVPEDPRKLVQCALNRRQTDVVMLLLERVPNPNLLSLTENGECVPPLHVAFKSGIDTGNFRLFEKVQRLGFVETIDAHGNTLLHLALQSSSRQAVDQLIMNGLVVDNCNEDEKMAVDYLTSSKDERAEKLMDFFISNMQELTETDLPAPSRESGEFGWLEEIKLEPEDHDIAEKDGESVETPDTNTLSDENYESEQDEGESETDLWKDGDQDDSLWEVDCARDVMTKLNSKDVSPHMREKINRMLKRLACGVWRPKDYRQLDNAKPIRLFEGNITKGERLIWELAIAFSPTQSTKTRIVYSDVIRVWDIVLQHKNISAAVQRIKLSHERGLQCRHECRKRLRVLPCSSDEDKDLYKPVLYEEDDAADEKEIIHLYPPVSPDKREYQIQKFYDFVPDLEYSALKNTEVKIDTPFRVTELEFKVINLKSDAPILLMGRSGTGKTTCCLFRLWDHFVKYWTLAEQNGDKPVLSWRQRRNWTENTEDENSDESVGLERETEEPREDEEQREEENEDLSDCASKSASVSVDLDADGACSNLPESESDSLEHTSSVEQIETADRVESATQHVHLHQMFVTKNPVLCAEVRENFHRLCHGNPLAADHVAVEKNPFPHRLQDMNEYQFPLFLTSRQLINMLDASLPGQPFFDRKEDGSPRGVIPDLFVPLPDLHHARDEEEEDLKTLSKSSIPREVKYEVFEKEIWPAITTKVKVSYHPVLVWIEITSFIKGSQEALKTAKGYLDQEGYQDLGRKKAPNFTGDRGKIYDLFNLYKKFLQHNNMYDEADVVFRLYQRLRRALSDHRGCFVPFSGMFLPWVIHEIYVDETQDFTQAELFLMICFTERPNEMFLTGDTAQSIMQGVAFRFVDLKTLFFHAKEDEGISSNHLKIKVPDEITQLTQNYRSHERILRLASGVLHLLVRLFPESFDEQKCDHGFLPGDECSPVLLEAARPSDLITLLRGNQRKTTSHIEFGAHQVILVADRNALRNLPKELRKANRLTIYQAKGLEFDDVLLYNFFKDSQAKKDTWDVITSCMEDLCEEQENATSSTRGLAQIHEAALSQKGRQPRKFDERKHKILISDLKHLYTAVTRARNRVYIFDEDEDKRTPMFEYFKRRNLVQVRGKAFCKQLGEQSADSDDVSAFVSESKPEEWEKQGDEFIKNSLYEAAANCYSNARNKHKQVIALALSRTEAAESKKESNEAKVAFHKAAILFLECYAESTKQKLSLQQQLYLAIEGAAKCLSKGGRHLHAAKIFEKNKKLEEAAKEFEKGKERREASRCLETLKNFDLAIECFLRGNVDDHEEALKCLKRYEKAYGKNTKETPPGVTKPRTAFTEPNLILRKAGACHAIQAKSEMLITLERLTSPDEKVSFLEKWEYIDDAADVLMKRTGTNGRSDAIQLFMKHQQLDKGIKLAEEGTDIALTAKCYLTKARVLHATKAGSEHQPKENTEKALKLFMQVKEGQSFVGDCLLLLSLLQKDKKLAEDALGFFNQVGNLAGIVECHEVLTKLALERKSFEEDHKTCQKVLEHIHFTTRLIHLLLKKVHQQQEKRQYRQCLQFFGFEVIGQWTLTFYPQFKPRWMDISGKKEQLSSTKVETGTENAVERLTQFLMRRSWRHYLSARSFIGQCLDRYFRCLQLMKGETCHGYHFENVHLKDQTRTVLNLLEQQIRLDNSIACMADHLSIPSSKQHQPWHSLEIVLNVLFPAGLSACDLSTVKEFCRECHGEVKNQIQRYLQHLERNPGKGKRIASLIQRCRSTQWIVLSSLLTSLFVPDRKHDACCTRLEWDLKKVANCSGMLAVLAGQRLPIARKYLDAHSYLMDTRFDPYIALDKFARFIKLLGDRKSVSLMPELHILFFWLETFGTLALCLAAKFNRSKKVIALPAIYNQRLQFLNLLRGNDNLPERVHAHKFKKGQTWDGLQGMIKNFFHLLCGTKIEDFKLLEYLSKANEKKPSQGTRLLLERGWVLSLVLLLNSNLGNVSDKCSRPVLHLLQELNDQTEEHPQHLKDVTDKARHTKEHSQRLKDLTDKARNAKDFAEIFSAVSNTLSKMATTLQFYHWELKDRQILQLITDTPPTLSGPLPQIQTEEEEIADEQAAPKEHQQDELVKPSEEEHMSKEDLEDMNQRLRETRESEAKLGDEEEPTLENTNKSESVMSHFPAHIIVTDSMCNICGRLASQENVPTSKAEHEQTSLHQETEVEYRRFHAECQKKVALSLDKIDSFFTEIQMEQHRHLYDENSAELACFDKFKKVKQMVLDAIDGRQWDKIDDLIREVQELQNIFVSRNVESTLSEVFSQHKNNHPEQIAESSCRTTLGRPLSLCSAADFLVDE